MVDVFISYSHKDQKFAFKLHAWLVQLGIDAWIDKTKIIGGEKWVKAIEEGLENCKVMLLILTPDSINSENVADEWQYHLDQKKPLIPLLLRPTKLKFRIHRLQYIDFYEQEEFVAFLQLKSVLEKYDIKTPSTFSKENSTDFLEEKWHHSVSENFVQLLNQEDQELHVLSNIINEQSFSSMPVIIQDDNNLLFENDIQLINRFKYLEHIYIKSVIIDSASGSRLLVVDLKLKNGRSLEGCLLQFKYTQNTNFLIRYLQASATYIGKFIPQLVDVTPWDANLKRVGLLFTIFTQTGKSLDYLLRSRLGDANTLIYEITKALQQWNITINIHHLNIFELILYTFRHSNDPTVLERLLKNDFTNIFTRASSTFDFDPNSITVVIGNRNYLQPNPLAYVGNDLLWKQVKDKMITSPFGHIHGNLTPREILDLRQNDNRSLGITNLDNYDPQNLIFLDFAHLEITIAMELFEIYQYENETEIEQFSEYLASDIELKNFPNLSLISVGIATILGVIRHTVSTICKQHPDYPLTFWIARLSAGLQLSRRISFSNKKRMIGLLFAADSLKHILTELQILYPNHEPSHISWPM